MSLDLDPAKLLSTLAEKLDDNSEKISEKGFEEILKGGDKLIEDLKLEGDAKDGAEAVLKELEENKQPFLRLSGEAFGYVLGHFANDEEETAMNHYIATQATYAERRKWMQEGGDLAVKDREERDAAWENVKMVLKKIVLKGLPFALKLVANGLGLPI
jgi:hypothetical protein